MNEVVLDEIKVMKVSVVGATNSSSAFNQLESKLETFKGRKFYGCLFGLPDTGIYSACVKLIESDKPNELGLEVGAIPGGKYLREKIMDWFGKEELIGKTFKEMESKTKIDTGRPYIEFYRSQKELILLLPIG